MSIKVLHVSPTHYDTSSVVGGGEKYLIYACQALRAGARCLGVELETSMLAFASSPGEVTLAGDIRCKLLPGRAWDASSLDGKALANEFAPHDIVFVHQALHPVGLFAAAHAKLQSKVVIGVDHGGGEHRLAHHTPLVGAMFDAFHAQSQFAARAFIDLEGRTLVVPGPIDTDYYRPDLAVERVPDRVICIGRLLPHKGFDRVIKALPHQLSLHIVGSDYHESYKGYLHSLAEGKDVTFLHSLTDDQVLQELREASLMVHASTHVDHAGTYYPKPELLGLAPLEALACGTPALVSNAAALAELGVLVGCRVFSSDDELAQLLATKAAGALHLPSPQAIYRDVHQRYGLERFGVDLLSALIEIQSP